MERPTLNPLVYSDLEAVPAAPPRLAQKLFGLPRMLLRLMLADIAFWSTRPRLKIEDASPLRRIIRGLVYRLLLAPLALVLIVGATVYLGTHPARSVGVTDPLSKGTYYDPVNFVSGDGMRLEGWFVPALEAKIVIEQKDQALREERPAVILVHDDGATRLQMLPLVQPLHEAGYVVLVTSLRGTGANSAASTFGLKESGDVQAAVEFLRRRPGVNPKRIGILGVGTGANAALLAAGRDTEVAAIVLDHPTMGVEQLVQQRLAPPQPWLRFLRPVCKWTFEMAYRVDADDLDLTEQLKTMGSRPVLHLKDACTVAEAFHTRGLEQIQEFLARSMPESKAEPANATPSGTAAIEIK